MKISILFMLLVLLCSCSGGGGGGNGGGKSGESSTQNEIVISEEKVSELKKLWASLGGMEGSHWTLKDATLEARFKRSMEFGIIVEMDFPRISPDEALFLLEEFNALLEMEQEPDFRSIVLKLSKGPNYETI